MKRRPLPPVPLPPLPSPRIACAPGHRARLAELRMGRQRQLAHGLWAPKGSPRDAIVAMQAELRKAFATEELRNVWHSLGAETPNLYGDAFGQFVSAEIKRWAAVVKASGAKMD